MLNFESPVVIELLQAQGWTPQREVSIPALVGSVLDQQAGLGCPPALRALIPPHAAQVIAASLFVATMAARLLRQGEARHG